MRTPINYSDIQLYLTAISADPSNKGDVDDSGHGRFWNVPYNAFITGTIPNEDCNGMPIPIIDPNPSKCALYLALTKAGGFCGLAQMPQGGPFITDEGYEVTLADGTVISGADITANILWWITNGTPE